MTSHPGADLLCQPGQGLPGYHRLRSAAGTGRRRRPGRPGRPRSPRSAKQPGWKPRPQATGASRPSWHLRVRLDAMRRSGHCRCGPVSAQELGLEDVSPCLASGHSLAAQEGFVGAWVRESRDWFCSRSSSAARLVRVPTLTKCPGRSTGEAEIGTGMSGPGGTFNW
jgi:hypothetical protein